jgi:YHS domain-containing protein
MKRPFLTLSLLALTASGLIAKNLVNVDPKGIGIKGYDPVAYFTDHAAVKGDPSLRSTNSGVIYLFATADHKAKFDDQPPKYIPQFGGFCAYGVSREAVIPIDPSAFQIVDGHLLLQYSKGVLKKFNQDSEGNLAKANLKWPRLVDSKGR